MTYRTIAVVASLFGIVVGVLLAAPATAQNATTTSAGARSATGQAISVTSGVTYAQIDGTTLTLDVYRPASAVRGPQPAIVLVHGGAWATGTSTDMVQQARLLATQGWVAFSINYRTTYQLGQSGGAWPAEVQDVQRAIRWVGARAAVYGADASRIAVLGGSAGGYLAAMVAVIGTAADPLGHLPDPPDANPAVGVRAVAVWSGPTMLSELAPPASGGAPSGCGTDEQCAYFWSTPWVQRFLGCEPSECPDTYAAASPALRVTPATTPMWIANSTDELVPLDQARRLDSALAAMKVDRELRVVEGSGHAYAYTAQVWNEMVPWLAAKLGVPAPEPVEFPNEDIGLSAPEILVITISALLILGLAVAAIRHRAHEHHRPAAGALR